MGEWILWIAWAVFLYFCVYGIIHFSKLRSRGMSESREYLDPQGRFSFRYPTDWELSEERGRIRLITRDHDGVVTIVVVPKGAQEPSAAELLQKKLAESSVRLDEPELHSKKAQGREIAFVESRALKDTERLYIQEWIIDADGFRILLSYRCSVLYGLVDGYYIDQLVGSIEWKP